MLPEWPKVRCDRCKSSKNGEDHLFALKELMGHSRVETMMIYLRRLDRRWSMETVRGLDWGAAVQDEEIERSPL